MPGKIKQLLVSQPAPAVAEKSPFHELKQKFSLGLDYVPFIRVEGVSAKEFRGQHVDILAHTAIIFTNRGTIDHFFRICEQSRIAVPETMKYLCFTEAIALYLQKYIIYRKRKISFADGTFRGFMELILKHSDEKLLLALTEPHKPEIPLTLEKLKVKFSPGIFAHTVSSDLADVVVGDYQMVVLYSPSDVKALADRFGNDPEKLPMIATFGDGTTRKAMDNGLRVSVMAPTPEAPSMARALEIFITEFNAGRPSKEVVVPEDRVVDEFVRAHQSKESRRNKAKKK